METWQSFLLLSVFFTVACAECGPDDLKCCLTEFLTLVSPSGIKLGERSVNTSCKIREDTLTCIEDFSDQCVGTGNDRLQGSINRTMDFINTMCLPTSDFIKGVEKYEDCFHTASAAFETCFNKTVMPESSDKWKTECCEYKDMRNCAVQTVESECGASASQLVHDAIMNINGAGLEAACEEVFEKCSNAAMTLASSFLTLFSIYSIFNLARFL